MVYDTIAVQHTRDEEGASMHCVIAFLVSLIVAHPKVVAITKPGFCYSDCLVL